MTHPSMPADDEDRSISTFQKWRLGAAGTALLISLLLPALKLKIHGTHGNPTWAMAIFACLMLPGCGRELVGLLRSWRIRLVLWSGLICAIGWKLFGGPIWNVERAWFYVVLPLFAAAAIAFFRQARVSGFRAVLWTKLTLAAVAAGWISILAFGLRYKQLWIVIQYVPFFSNFRYVNYDVLPAIAFAILLWQRCEPVDRVLSAIALMSLGYFTFWSGGRGEILGILVLLSLAVLSKAARENQIRLLAPTIFLLIGSAFVFLAGQTQFFGIIHNDHLNRPEDLAERVSTGRTIIWNLSLKKAWIGWDTFAFGFGPDAYERTGISRQLLRINPNLGGTSQPHDTLLLWHLEFGITGLVALSILTFHLMVKCINTIREGAATDAVISSLLVAMFVFSLFDGVLYQYSPLTLFVLLIAYLKSSPEKEVRPCRQGLDRSISVLTEFAGRCPP